MPMCMAPGTIREFAETIRDVVKFSGTLTFDQSKPNGTPRKLLDVSWLHALGWRAQIRLSAGLDSTYRCYLENSERIRR